MVPAAAHADLPPMGPASAGETTQASGSKF